ncbi:MAG: three component ABC system middle component, partial [Sphingomonas sp.]
MSLAAVPDLSEVDIVQNPAFGAFLMWHFALGYQEDGADAVSFALAFLVLPILLHRQTFEAVI